jgi:hypothetical protein
MTTIFDTIFFVVIFLGGLLGVFTHIIFRKVMAFLQED